MKSVEKLPEHLLFHSGVLGCPEMEAVRLSEGGEEETAQRVLAGGQRLEDGKSL